MAVVAVTNSNNRLTDADSTTGWSSDGGGGAGPQLEPDLGYQLTSGSNLAVSRKVGTTKGGHAYTHGSTTDMTAEANQVVMCKGVWYNSLNAAAYPACGFRIGNASANQNEYSVIDDGGQGDLDADPKQLVRIIPIDPNVVAWPDIITGTVTLTAIDFFGIQGDFGGSAKAENVAMDAIDLVRGVGVLWLVGGDSTDPDGTFDDFIAHDEGTIANRFGHWSTVRPGVLETFGKSWIGRTETATVFQDSAKTILFGPGFYDAGWTGIGVDLGSATTDIDWTDIVFQGQGQSGHKIYFDTITEIDPTPDEVTLSPAPGFITATPIVYNNDGGGDTIGLTSGATYWLEFVTATTFNVHSSRNNARTAAAPIALSDGSTGEAHWLQRTPDTRPDLDVVGTSGAFDVTRCTFDTWRNFLLTTGATFTSCIFRNCQLIDMTTNNGGSLQGCTFSGQTTEPGEALIPTNTTNNIDDCTFILTGDETGHAIEVDTTGSMALAADIFTGYWTSPDNDTGAVFDTTSGVGVDDTNNDITTTGNHGFSTGDEVYYNDNGGIDTIGLTDGVRYYVNVISATNFSLHRSAENATGDTNRVGLNNTGTGETHTFYSGNAAVVNTSGGALTLNITDGTAPSVRNVGAATTTVNASVSLELTGLSEGSRGVMLATDDSSSLLAGYANASGVISGSYSGATPRAVVIRARNGGIVNAAVLEDSGTGFTDFTLEAREDEGVDDVNFLPATPAVGDAFHIGGLVQFDEAVISVTQAGDTYVGVWEYWNGAWVSLTAIDGTSAFFTTGYGKIEFTRPGDWATTSVNGQGPYYYIRFRVTTGGGSQPQGERITLNKTIKYLPFNGTGNIAAGTGLSASVVWIEDPNNP